MPESQPQTYFLGSLQAPPKLTLIAGPRFFPQGSAPPAYPSLPSMPLEGRRKRHARKGLQPGSKTGGQEFENFLHTFPDASSLLFVFLHRFPRAIFLSVTWWKQQNFHRSIFAPPGFISFLLPSFHPAWATQSQSPSHPTLLAWVLRDPGLHLGKPGRLQCWDSSGQEVLEKVPVCKEPLVSAQRKLPGSSGAIP